jgi:hypothetical protein
MLYCFTQLKAPSHRPRIGHASRDSLWIRTTALSMILLSALLTRPCLSLPLNRTTPSRGPTLARPTTPTPSENHFLLGYEAQLHRPGITPNPFHILTVGAEFTRESSDSRTRVDAQLAFNPENLKVWALRNPEARTTWNLSDGLRFTLGRKLHRWNELDSSWNLSFIQPIDQWDRFRPAQQGLIGAFVDMDAGPFTLHLFGSYLMYPENIPNVVIENGKFASYHPQAISSTPQTITLLNQTTSLNYEIDYPVISDVVFRPSLMASLESPARSPLIFRILYGWKPYNFFTYALRGVLSIPANQIQIHIKPRVNHHQVIAGDLGYRVPETPLQFGVSALSDLPGPEMLSGTEYTYAPLSQSTLISPWLEWRQSAFGFRASQLVWKGGTEADIGPYANPGAAVISSHVFYRNATQLSAHIQLPFVHERARIEGRWIHEYEIGADTIGGDLTFPVSTSLGEMRILAGGDLVQTTLDSNPNRGSEMLIDLRTLDRARLGVTLAF